MPVCTGMTVEGCGGPLIWFDKLTMSGWELLRVSEGHNREPLHSRRAFLSIVSSIVFHNLSLGLPYPDQIHRAKEKRYHPYLHS